MRRSWCSWHQVPLLRATCLERYSNGKGRGIEVNIKNNTAPRLPIVFPSQSTFSPRNVRWTALLDSGESGELELHSIFAQVVCSRSPLLSVCRKPARAPFRVSPRPSSLHFLLFTSVGKSRYLTFFPDFCFSFHILVLSPLPVPPSSQALDGHLNFVGFLLLLDRFCSLSFSGLPIHALLVTSSDG